MAEGFNWICPTCGTHTTITAASFDTGDVVAQSSASPIDSHVQLGYLLIDCPNNSCGAQTFTVTATPGTWATPPMGGRFFFKPSETSPKLSHTFWPTTPVPLSPHVPKQVLEDYNEAYLIKSLSPKASATLARRALQGMVRDFFQVHNKGTLHAELEAIKDKCDGELYDAMMAVKSVGNIGAHPEKDVSLMVEVEPDEAETLLNLIHLLDHEWYVARAERATRIAKMQALGTTKKQAQKPASHT